MKEANAMTKGAHVVADVLCGTSEIGFPASAPLAESIANKSELPIVKTRKQADQKSHRSRLDG